MHYNLLLLTTLIYSASASGVVQPWNEADDYTTNTIAGKYVSGFSDGDELSGRPGIRRAVRACASEAKWRVLRGAFNSP